MGATSWIATSIDSISSSDSPGMRGWARAERGRARSPLLFVNRRCPTRASPSLCKTLTRRHSPPMSPDWRRRRHPSTRCLTSSVMGSRSSTLRSLGGWSRQLRLAWKDSGS